MTGSEWYLRRGRAREGGREQGREKRNGRWWLKEQNKIEEGKEKKRKGRRKSRKGEEGETGVRGKHEEREGEHTCKMGKEQGCRSKEKGSKMRRRVHVHCT